MQAMVDAGAGTPAATRNYLPWLQGAWAFAALTVLLALFRTPRAVLIGRIWGEEGVFGSHLIKVDLWDALTYIYNGTFFILTSLPVWFALQAPLEWSALLLTWFALLLQIVFVLLFRWWAQSSDIPPWAVVLGTVALLLHPAMYRLSANATNAQWMASLSVFILLVMPAAPLRRRLIASGAWTIVAGLTGVCSSMLAPAFLARGVLLRSRGHLVLGMILATTALIQVFFIRVYPPTGRSYAIWPLFSLVATAVQTVWVNLVGVPIRIISGYASGDGVGPALASIALIAGAGTLVGFLYRLASQTERQRERLIVLLGTWLYISVLNYFGAIGPQLNYLKPIAGERYFAIGTVAYVVLCLLVTRHERRGWIGYSLLVWMLALGVVQGFIPRFYDEFSDGPNWRSEVARCRETPDMSCRARIWPARNLGESPWTIDIPADRLRRDAAHG